VTLATQQQWGAIRALPILSALADRPYAAPELDEALSIPPVTALKILHRLAGEGFIELVPRLDYEDRWRYQLSGASFDFAYGLLEASVSGSRYSGEPKAIPRSNHDHLGGIRALAMIAVRPYAPGEFIAATGLPEKASRLLLRHLVAAGFLKRLPRAPRYQLATPAFELALKLLNAARDARPPIGTRTIGEAIRAYRLSREISQPNFAETIGMSLDTYRQVETNNYDPDLDELWAWADHLRADPLALLLVTRTKGDLEVRAFRTEVADPGLVLRALSLLVERSYSTPEMSKALGCNPSLARRMLQRLVKAGFVELVPYAQIARYQVSDLTYHLGLKLVTAAIFDERQRPLQERTAGESVRAYRRGRGLSLIRFAQMVGTSNVTLGRLERGEHHLNHQRLNDWSARLGVDVLDLLLIRSRALRLADGSTEDSEDVEEWEA
jgi:DNA-binding IclR family transcriptional regulator